MQTAFLRRPAGRAPPPPAPLYPGRWRTTPRAAPPAQLPARQSAVPRHWRCGWTGAAGGGRVGPLGVLGLAGGQFQSRAIVDDTVTLAFRARMHWGSPPVGGAL